LLQSREGTLIHSCCTCLPRWPRLLAKWSQFLRAGAGPAQLLGDGFVDQPVAAAQATASRDREAALQVLAEAEAEAAKLVDDAKAEAAKIVAEANVEIARVKAVLREMFEAE
jgi:hypothetical protein